MNMRKDNYFEKKGSILFELSGEYTELPFYELEQVLNFCEKDAIISNHDRINRLVYVQLPKLDLNLIKNLTQRLAMTKNIFEVIVEGGIDDFNHKLNKLDHLDTINIETFKLRLKHLKERVIISPEIETKLRNSTIRRLEKNFKVNVKSPDVEFVLLIGQEIKLIKKIGDIDRRALELRKPQFRPYFAPISLHPKLARAMINLAPVNKYNKLLDPFCGTGGILIEGGLMGFDVLGSDIDLAMVNGTRENLKHFGINNYQLIHSGINDLPQFIEPINIIITEPPYGRATAMKGETLESLMVKSFKAISKILLKDGYLVITLPDEDLVKFTVGDLELKNKIKIRIHRSLTKHIFVFQKTDGS